MGDVKSLVQTLLIPANHHIPARAKGVASGAFGVARPVASLGLVPDGGSALADGLGYFLWAVPCGTQAHGDHAVHAGEVGKRHVLAQVGITRVVGCRGAGTLH